jgi:hypothetical protein
VRTGHSSTRRIQSSTETERVDSATLDWPFFTDSHRELAARLDKWARQEITEGIAGNDEPDVDLACSALVK